MEVSYSEARMEMPKVVFQRDGFVTVDRSVIGTFIPPDPSGASWARAKGEWKLIGLDGYSALGFGNTRRDLIPHAIKALERRGHK
jgi:hypothetical protein